MVVLILFFQVTANAQTFDRLKVKDSILKLMENNERKACMELLHGYLRIEDELTQTERVGLYYEYAAALKRFGKVEESIEALDKMKENLSKDQDEYNWFNQRLYRQKTYMYFDTHKMDSSKKYLNLILNDRSEISERDMVFIKNIQAYFEFLDENYRVAERIYLDNVEFMLKDKKIYCGLPLTSVKMMQLYGKTGEVKKLKEIYNETLKVCEECKDSDGEMYARYVMAEISYDLAEYKTAHEEYMVARSMDDSIKELKNLQALAELDKKYQSELKDKTIEDQELRHEATLKAQKEKESLTNSIFIGVAVVILIIIFFLWRTIKQRRQLKIQNVEIEKNLEEKQLLLKEIHHRVKNNFQVVSSLLEMQTRGIEDEQALELAKEGQNRIKSMAIIHQKLYQNDDLLIEFSDYARRLVQEIQNAFAPKEMRTKIEIEPDLALDIDTAIPLGLVLNELITNAFKYGFDDQKEENNLLIKIEKGLENYSLIVADNGKGIPDEVDLKKTKSLGLYLVRRLSKQLRGKMNYSNENGSRFEIIFQDTAMRIQ